MQPLEELEHRIRNRGAGAIPGTIDSPFGFPVLAEGLYLQQDPYELAALTEFLGDRGYCLALHIGIASGGMVAWLNDNLGIDENIVVDLGLHHEAGHWPRIKAAQKNMVLAAELVHHDSHSAAVAQALAPFKGRIDLAVIDGDHSYAGVLADAELAGELGTLGCRYVFHDTLAVPDVRQACDRLVRSRGWLVEWSCERRYGLTVLRTPT